MIGAIPAIAWIAIVAIVIVLFVGSITTGTKKVVHTVDHHDDESLDAPERVILPQPVQVGRRRRRDPLARMGVPEPWRTLLDWVVTIAGAIIIVLALKAWVVNPYRIPSSSMEPTLHCARPAQGCEASGGLLHGSDRILADRLIYHFEDPKRGQVIVFKTPGNQPVCDTAHAGEVFVKRLIGLPGETVKEDAKGYIYIGNSKTDTFFKLKEPYIQVARRLGDTSHFNDQWKVPAGSYFFMGDNRDESCDSRDWGSVPRKNIIGEVFFVYWPPSRIGFR